MKLYSAARSLFEDGDTYHRDRGDRSLGSSRGSCALGDSDSCKSNSSDDRTHGGRARDWLILDLNE